VQQENRPESFGSKLLQTFLQTLFSTPRGRGNAAGLLAIVVFMELRFRFEWSTAVSAFLGIVIWFGLWYALDKRFGKEDQY